MLLGYPALRMGHIVMTSDQKVACARGVGDREEENKGGGLGREGKAFALFSLPLPSPFCACHAGC